MSEISSYLRGKTLLITGATGFLAKGVVEKILRCVPDVGCLHLLVRSRRKKDGTTLSARDRMRTEIFLSPAFELLREIHGNRLPEFLDDRVRSLEGDLTLNHLGLEPDQYKQLATEVDIVLTCAASVTFDEEIDAALQLNALGAKRMVDFALACKKAMLIHVSTAYVNGQRTGRIREAPPVPNRSMVQEMGRSDELFDLETEIQEILARADEIHDESRSPAQQKRFRKMAYQQNARPTTRWLDAQTETFRKRWLKEQLIGEGIRRGQQRGWHDSYTLTKAMGEQLIVKHRGDLPTAIIRPSIVESALAEPEPGWIEGLKVADPLIDAMSKGRLPDFPGTREMIVDIIPVDIVVNAILAAMPRTDREGGICVYHVSTGDRNPIRFQQAFELSYDYFKRNPRLNRNNEPIPIRKWTYPTLAQFQRRYHFRYIYPLNAALWLLNRFGWIGALNNLKRRITVVMSAISRMLYYASIYSPYTSLNCVFDTTRTVQLFESLSPDDKRLLDGDVSRIDWTRYFQEIHIPGLKRHVLKTDEPKRVETVEEEVAERSGFSQSEEDELPHLDTLTDILAKSADTYGDKIALQIQDERGWTRYSYKEVRDLASHIGWSWRKRGLRPGDRLLLYAENSPAWGIACFAGMVAGAILVPVDRRLPVNEVGRIVQQTEAKAVLCSVRTREKLMSDDLSASARPVNFWNIGNYGLPFDVPPQDIAQELLNPEPTPWAPVEPDMPAAILYTRGGTKESQGVVLSHRNFVANLLSLAEILRAYRTDRFLSVLPLSQALEFTGGFLMPFYAGATTTCAVSMNPRYLVKLMEEARITCLIATPRIYQLLYKTLRQVTDQRVAGQIGQQAADQQDQELISRFRLLVSGGGALSSKLYHDYLELGLTIHEGYGLTEASPVVTVNPMDRTKPDSVGVELPETALRIDHPDEEGVGEIMVKGDHVMQGYYQNPVATAERIRYGWLYTGDVGRIDEDGYLYILKPSISGAKPSIGGTHAGSKTTANATAFFDVDGTIINATIVHYYAYLKTVGHSAFSRGLWIAGFLPKILYFILLDKVSRSRFIRVFYRQYRNLDRAHCVSHSQSLFADLLRPRMFSGAIERIRAHKQKGERVVLVTGSLDFIMEPLAEYTLADDLIAVSMGEENGRLTGEALGPPIGDEAKARIVEDYAVRHGIDLSQCYGYADSSSDLPMLRIVGQAVAVNPSGKLRRTAETENWEIVHWTDA